MFKHANTFAPGDRVTKMQKGVKLAGADAEGKVTAMQDGKFRVLFDDGNADFVAPEDLVKQV